MTVQLEFMRSLKLVFSGLLIMLILGCRGRLESGPARAVVSGMVTYQGKPVNQGTISFVPQSGSDLPVSGAEIVDGRYLANNKGGVAIGDYQVQISGWMPDPKANGAAAPPGVGAVTVQFLPEKYNVKSELNAKVNPSKEMVIDFTLQ